MLKKLEIAVASIESAIVAAAAGAHRLELCDNLGEGGTTPSYGTIAYAMQHIAIPVYPIIRPRGGDFNYSLAEHQVVLYDIAKCQDLGCKGVVIGMLDADGQINVSQLRDAITAAQGMQITFHRAFDRSKNALESLQILIDHGVQTVLTSGQMANAPLGSTNIAGYIQFANGRICIMPGAGVRANNLAALIAETNAEWYHSSAALPKISTMQYINDALDKSLPQFQYVDEQEIKNLLKTLHQ